MLGVFRYELFHNETNDEVAIMGKVRIIPLPHVHVDSRRMISEAQLPVSLNIARVNHIVLTDAVTPTMALGGHLHRTTTEWFLLAAGGFAQLVIGAGADRRVYERLLAPCLVECPAGLPHTFVGPWPGTILLTLADRPYDERDTVPSPDHEAFRSVLKVPMSGTPARPNAISQARALMTTSELQGHPLVGEPELVEPAIPFFGRVLHERRRTPAGDLDYYAILRHFGWSVTFGVTTAGEVLTLIQWKHGHNQAGWELPPGGIGRIEEDAPIDIIEHRTRETYLAETGYGGGVWTYLGHDVVETGKYRGATPNSHGVLAHCFLAEGLERLQDPNPQPEEQYAVLAVPLSEWPAVLGSGLFTETSAVSCAYRAMLRLGRLQWVR
ncbi:hypothetical protein HY634_03440 [Candidatus Uhrbacteria bacterium]|nr:hypothetical protein [Candidatus Uhrbacteria bacterium]